MDDYASSMRNSMKLDFGSASTQAVPPPPNTSDLISAILKSPGFEKLTRDLSEFKVPQATTQQLPTPTPTKMLFPAEVSNEQRQYAQGFLDALRHVQQVNNFKPTLPSPSILDRFQPLINNLSPQPSPLGSSTRDFEAIINAIQVASEKEKRESEAVQPPVIAASTSSSILPQTSVPNIFANPNLEIPKPPKSDAASINSSDDSGDDSDSSMSRSVTSTSGRRKTTTTKKDLAGMDEQEAKKLERKRLRNRQAASKCRQKKLQRISELEVVVNQERENQKNLDYNLELLRKQVHSLESAIQQHQARGCSGHI